MNRSDELPPPGGHQLPQQYQGYPPGQMPPPMSSEDALNLQRLISIVLRRKFLIAGIVLGVTALTFLFVNQITPLFQANTLIIVQQDRESFVEVKNVVDDLDFDWTRNETEAVVVRSRELAKEAVERLDLVNSPMFNPVLRPPRPSLTQRMMAPVRALLGQEANAGAPQATPVQAAPVLSREALIEQITDAYLGGLAVEAVKNSRILTVTYTSRDPVFAAQAVNLSSQLYVTQGSRMRNQAASQAGSFLSGQIDEARDRLRRARGDLAQFRAQTGVVMVTDDLDIYQQQRASLNNQLILARTELAEAQARHAQVRRLVQQRDEVETVQTVIQSPLIISLRNQEAQVLRELGNLRAKYRDGHPRMAIIKTELGDIREKIWVEVEKIARSLRNEVEVQRARAVNLETEATRLDAKINDQASASLQLEALEGEVETTRTLYESLLTRQNEVGLQDDSLQAADARLISPATVPGAPFYPRKKIIVMGAFLVSGVLAVVLAVLLDFMDSGFRSARQLETHSGLPTLGIVPFLQAMQKRGKRPHEIVFEKPNSAFTEAVRTVRTGQMLSDHGNSSRVLLVTSALPGEGKTTTAVAVAAVAACSGQRVLLIEGDLRQPTLHGILDAPNDIGLSEYLTGSASLKDVISVDPQTGLHFIPAGGYLPNPSDALGSHNMQSMLQHLSSVYDLVVIDTPPLLAVSDCLMLVRHVDSVMFVVRWEKTRRGSAMTGLKAVLDAGGRVGGLVLSQVNLRKHAKYAYGGDGAYYYDDYKGYYVE